MLRQLFLTACLCALPLAAPAQEISACDWRARLDAIPEPLAEHVFTYANGNVRLAITDTVEPAAGAFHVVLVSPPFDEVGARQCNVISAQGTTGFARVYPLGLRSGYDPATGLLFDLPVALPTSQGTIENAMLSMTLNQSTGQITARLGPAD